MYKRFSVILTFWTIVWLCFLSLRHCVCRPTLRQHRVDGANADENVMNFEDFFATAVGCESKKKRKEPLAIADGDDKRRAIKDEGEDLEKKKRHKVDDASKPEAMEEESDMPHFLTGEGKKPKPKKAKTDAEVAGEKLSQAIARITKWEMRMVKTRALMKVSDLSEPLANDVTANISKVTTMRADMNTVLSGSDVNRMKTLVNEYATFERHVKDLMSKCVPWTKGAQEKTT
jgi:hypothetical protein